MRRVVILAIAISLFGAATAEAYEPVMADPNGDVTIIPTTDRSVTDGRAVKCKQTAYGKICYGLVPAASFTQTIISSGYIHPWNSAAAKYWGVWDWCHPSTVVIVWLNDSSLPFLGAAVMDGCWTGVRVVWLNTGHGNISVAGASEYRSWCAIVVHEWGHLIGLRWEYCPAGWVHECSDPNHIMYYRGINHIPAGC